MITKAIAVSAFTGLEAGLAFAGAWPWAVIAAAFVLFWIVLGLGCCRMAADGDGGLNGDVD